MYNEDLYKKHIFWIKAKRVFLLLLFTTLGTALGVVISSYVVDVLLFNLELKPIIIAGCGLTFLLVTLLLTAKTGKEVHDAYWRIAVINELQSISKKLDSLDNLEKLDSLEKLKSMEIRKIKKVKTKGSFSENTVNTSTSVNNVSNGSTNEDSSNKTEDISDETVEKVENKC